MSCGRALLIVLLVGALFVALAWVERAPLLRKAAQEWIVADEPQRADAVAVLGGGIDDRPFAAAAYYRQGLVTQILVSADEVGPAAQLGATPSDTEANRQVLLKLGVPESAIAIFGSGSRSTYDEAVALRAWAQEHQAHRIIVPSELFAARRVRWIMHRVLGDETTIVVPALEPKNYQWNNWWQSDEGLVAFQNEILKYAYYRLRY